MKRFVFRYQTLLDVRERARKEEEERLQALFVKLNEVRGNLSQLERDEQAQRDAWLSLQIEGVLPLDEVAMIQQFMTVLARRIVVEGRALEEANARVDNQREILSEAMRQVEVIRKLKERDERAWRDELERLEAAELDELATLRYAYVRRSV